LNPDIVVDNNLKIIEQWNSVSRGKIEKIGNIFVWIREELQIYFILAPFGVLSFDVKEKSALFLIDPRKNPFEVGKKLIRIFGGL